jgi:signal transduction histidine kinase
MKDKLFLPIRLKILISLLLAVTTVVSLITFTMANLFHDDKKAYVNDLSSILAIGMAEECRSLMAGYSDRLRMYGRIMSEERLDPDGKSDLLRGFFEDFEDLIAITLYRNGEELASIYDQKALEVAGLAKEDLQDWRERNPIAQGEMEAEEVLLENATLSEEMPSFALTLTLPQGDETPLVVSSLLRLDRLQRLVARGTSFEISIFDENGKLLAHPNHKLVTRHAAIDPPKEIQQLQNSRSAAITLTVDGPEGTEFIASYAGVDVGDLVVSARIPKNVAYLAARDLVKTLVGIALVLLILSAIASLVGSRRITRPVERLSAAAKDIGRGRFDVQVEVGSNDEMGTLAGSFNQMATELQNREVALKEAQAQLVQSEKMAAFGQLGAGIAHEVKNPLAGILGCAQIALRKVEEAGLKKNLELIERETRRCKTIVENLLKFARKDKIRLEAVDLNQVVKDAIAIVNHQLELHKVKLHSDLVEDVPYIMGNANQLQQVLMNLMINAQQAMEGQAGSVAVSTRLTQRDRVEVKVSDTGPGIPEDMRQRIFEPFFTTKPGGKGTGLGLSVSYGIIKEHKGDIIVESQPGEGCTFVITIPIVKEASASEPDSRVA